MRNTTTLLVIRMSALGDVAMTIPVIYSLANQYPDTQIKILTQAFFTNLFVNHPRNISFIIIDRKKKHRGIIGLFRLLQDLNKQNIDCVADFHNILRSWVIDVYFQLRGIPVSIVNKGRKKRKKLTQIKNKEIVMQRNYILRYTDAIKKLNFPITLSFTSLFTPNEKSEVLLPISLPSNVPLIGIAPFARYSTKTYPLQLMEQVVCKLAQKGYALYLFGSKGEEQKKLQLWEQKYKSCTALPGLLTLQEELVLMSRLNMMLTMDSANMHLASLVSTPVVSIWGSTTPHCGFLGWNQKENDAIYLQLPCQPCSISGKKECPLHHFSCMKSIDPDRICKHIEEHISNIANI